jgi:serine/threonine protein kinase
VSSTGDRVVAGRYRLRRQLGQGSMGTVWEAFDEFLHRTVSVKEVLLPPGVPDAEAAELRERTLREARAIAALSHPNVITLHDVAREDGEPFVVTEYLLAHSLATLISVLGPLPTPMAAAICDAVAAGLAAAHQAGITHRDVKPGNVLIGVDGQIKLTDFGIARNVSEQTLTSTGIMLGSPSYIAPEVAAGREVTPAADLWGLGATLFAAVEGRPPYDVNGAVLDTVNQVVHGEVPTPSTDGPLCELVAALMVKDPEKRITLREVRNTLHPLLPPPSTPLLSEQDLTLLNDATAKPADTDTDDPSGDTDDDTDDTDDTADHDTDEPAPTPLAAEPSPTPSALAPAPGPLPFDVTVRRPVRPRRGVLASVVLLLSSVLVFLAAAGGGFALSRYVGGEPLLPPTSSTPTTTRLVPEEPGALKMRKGNAATETGAQGGGFTLPVPGNWVEFVEGISDEDLANSTRVYFVSTDGTQLLMVERLAPYYPDHTIGDYVERLESKKDDVSIEVASNQQIPGLPNAGIAPAEAAVELNYRSTTNARELVPGEPAAADQYRGTFAWLLPFAGDLWVVSVTVPIDQEDSGRALFDQIAPKFMVTG